MSKYAMHISWDNTDGIFVVEVPELPGCMAHGETRAEAVRNAEDAISAWIDVAKETGRSVPEPNVRDCTA